MTTLVRWHVTDRPWDGGDLVCREEQDDPGEWKWDEADEGHDTEFVSLFTDEAEAREFQAEFAPNGSVLRIELDHLGGNDVFDGDQVRYWGLNREGYEAVVGRISHTAVTEQ